MDESEGNEHGQSGNVKMDLRNDLRKYESQYRRIVNENGMTLVNQRSFQIGLFILITISILFMGYMSPNVPYSYILSLIAVAAQWYLFFLYEKLRALLKSKNEQQDALAYFRQKRDTIVAASYLRKVSLANAILVFMSVWATRSPERLFNNGAIALLVFIGLMSIGVIIHYRLRISPTVIYLKDLVRQLEEENTKTKRTN
jgi:hypothetical protein